jgi:hypothetical protein
MLPSVFQKGLGTLKGFKAKIYVDTDAVPRFHPARSVQRDRVDKELKRLQEEGTLEPVDISEWADPIVAVLKSDKIVFEFAVTSASRSTRYRNWIAIQSRKWKTCSRDSVEESTSQSLTLVMRISRFRWRRNPRNTHHWKSPPRNQGCCRLPG